MHSTESSGSISEMIAGMLDRTDRMNRTDRLSILLALLLLTGATGCGSRSVTLERPSSLPEELLPKRADLTVTPITALNSKRDDFGATMGLDTSLIFFTSNRIGAEGVHSIFWSTRTGTTWTVPAPAPAINSIESNGMPSISPGGEVMHFTGCDYGFGDCDIYRVASGLRGSVQKETVPWSIPRNLGSGVNGFYWDSQPSVSADGSILAFASNRPGGFGGRDIWLCLRAQDGGWGVPINAGAAINTVFDEITPWVAPDGRTLYFSSNGHPGIDGFDIYSVGLDPDGGLRITTEAENLGRPINSAAHDIAFSLSADGSRAFFSSTRSGGMGGYDLYEVSEAPFEVAPLGIVEGRVLDPGGRGLLAEVEVVNLRNGNVLGRFQTNPSTGTYRLIVRRGLRYAIVAEASGFLYNTALLEVPRTITTDTRYELTHRVQTMEGWVRLLVFFAPGSPILDLESSVDLDRAVSFLRANPEVRVEIGGHTDSEGSPEENERLSLDRAESVKAYMVGNRVDPKRIEVVGYGQTRPIAENTSPEGRALNRRVEMRILAGQ